MGSKKVVTVMACDFQPGDVLVGRSATVRKVMGAPEGDYGHCVEVSFANYAKALVDGGYRFEVERVVEFKPGDKIMIDGHDPADERTVKATFVADDVEFVVYSIAGCTGLDMVEAEKAEVLS